MVQYQGAWDMMVFERTIFFRHADAGGQCKRYHWNDLSKKVRKRDGTRSHMINHRLTMPYRKMS